VGEPTCWQCTCLVALEFKPARRGIPSKAHVGLFRLLTNSYVIHAYSQTASSQRSQLATCLFPGGCCMESSFHIFEQMKRSSAEVRIRWLAPTLCVSSGIPTSTVAHLVFLGVQKQMIEISLPLPDLSNSFYHFGCLRNPPDPYMDCMFFSNLAGNPVVFIGNICLNGQTWMIFHSCASLPKGNWGVSPF